MVVSCSILTQQQKGCTRRIQLCQKPCTPITSVLTSPTSSFLQLVSMLLDYMKHQLIVTITWTCPYWCIYTVKPPAQTTISLDHLRKTNAHGSYTYVIHVNIRKYPKLLCMCKQCIPGLSLRRGQGTRLTQYCTVCSKKQSTVPCNLCSGVAYINERGDNLKLAFIFIL